MFIVFAPIPSRAVRRSGTQVDRYAPRNIPLLRTANVFSSLPVYKHLTPNRVKAVTSLRTSKIEAIHSAKLLVSPISASKCGSGDRVLLDLFANDFITRTGPLW